jgi:hypothetical protein
MSIDRLTRFPALIEDERVRRRLALVEIVSYAAFLLARLGDESARRGDNSSRLSGRETPLARMMNIGFPP